MHGERCSAAELADIRPKVRRLMRGPPENPRDHRGKINQSDADVNIDPERPRSSRNIIEQKPQAAEENDQRGDRLVKSHRTGPVTRRRGCHAVLHRISHRQTDLVSQSLCGLLSLRDVFLQMAVCSGFVTGSRLGDLGPRPQDKRPSGHVRIGAPGISFRNVAVGSWVRWRPSFGRTSLQRRASCSSRHRLPRATHCLVPSFC
jgi:hypothetical protein